MSNAHATAHEIQARVRKDGAWFREKQSLLLVLLPVELRLLIWEHVLGRTHDEDALHLDIRDGILRYRQCYEVDLSKLGFRHICWSSSLWFRQEGKEDDGLMPYEPRTSRGLLSLLPTCKLIYDEAIDILYESNTFDFRRAASITRLPHVMQRLQRIRSISLSTSFACPLRMACDDDCQMASSYRYRRPDAPSQWLAACKILASLEQLEDLKIVIAMWPWSRVPGGQIDDGDIVAVLKPLKAVHAATFTVVLTTSFTEDARHQLGPTSFVVTQRERPGIGYSSSDADD